MTCEQQPDVILAGHLCLDVIPALKGPLRFVSGSHIDAGPARVSPGGCVANTGVSLHRLGVEVRLVAKLGDDAPGGLVREALARAGEGLTRDLITAPGEGTSYTLVLGPPGEDRMFIHHPGPNDDFTADDIPEEVLTGARIFHFGYPPSMRRMYEDGGENLARTLRRAREASLTTSLDTTFPDPDSGAGSADWPAILEESLPETGVFLPSLEEILFMLEPESRGNPALLARAPVERIRRVGESLIRKGPAVVGIKCGERGLYLRTASRQRLKSAGPGFAGDLSGWAKRELWSTAFEVEVAGTVGAGDAAVAGFLLGLLRGYGPEETVTAACAAGAMSVESADATSGVGSWEETRERIAAGWPRATEPPAEGWVATEHHGVFRGPGDLS